jgi:hypothetical protein
VDDHTLELHTACLEWRRMHWRMQQQQ